jgi:hypothetical protein
VVEDRHTVGLTGDELRGDSHFRALCKDTLFSHKRSEAAGGSYGLGKSVLWAFSGLSLVLFNSTLSDEAPGQVSPRLFGRVELPSHGHAGEHYAGAGWFGHVRGTGARRRAESVWGEAAATLAGDLMIGRRESTGTSIAIVGFRDPTTDDERTADELVAEVQAAIARNFWPALVMTGAPLTVWMGVGAPRPLVPDRDLTSVRPFIEAYRGRTSTRVSLDEPGDVVVRELALAVPERVDGTPAITGVVRVCIRLAADADAPVSAGEIAWFRGPGMVVRYGDRRRLAVGARPFHAVVACGEARAPEAVTEGDRAIERFLRAAEPPGHDLWESTATLKAEYRRGYAKALSLLEAQVDDAIRQVVIEAPRRGRAGPERLRKLFPMGRQGAAAVGPAAFHVRHTLVWFAGGRWHVRGQVRPSVPLTRWACTLALHVADEHGQPLAPVALERLDVAAAAAVDLDGGVARVILDGPLLVFDGASAAMPPTVGGPRSVTLIVTGREVET